jgi:hypothetical protein
MNPTLESKCLCLAGTPLLLSKSFIQHYHLNTYDVIVTYSSSIVTIHGLDRHRETSFIASNGILWLCDLLPETLPNARILTYSYDARIWRSLQSTVITWDWPSFLQPLMINIVFLLSTLYKWSNGHRLLFSNIGKNTVWLCEEAINGPITLVLCFTSQQV